MRKYIHLFLLVWAVVFFYYFFIDNNNIDYIENEIIEKNPKVQNDIMKVRYQKPGAKAIAFGVNGDGMFVYWYTYEMVSQAVADKIALKNCNRASRKLDVNADCKLYNELLTQRRIY